MFGWALAWAPARLREPRLWTAFAVIVVVVGAWLQHGQSIYAETGLSFGVVSGGDTKFPDVAHLLAAESWQKMAIVSVAFGFSVFGAIALLVAAWRRRLDLADASLLFAVALGLFVSFRYSHDAGLGPHYHVFAAAAGAWCVARAWPVAAPRTLWAVLLIAVAAQSAWRLHDERGVRNVVNASPTMGAAAVVRATSSPDALLIVRSDKPRRDAAWGRGNNFEDPRLFYQAKRRGYVLPVEQFDVASLVALRDRGAVFVFDSVPATTSPATAAWLAANGNLVFDQGGVHLHRLHSPN